MSRFKINIHQMQEENAILKEKYAQYKMDQDSLYKIALTADGNWNDNNTSVFIDCVEHDEKEMFKFHDTFYHCIESIDTFTTNLDTLLSTNGIVDVKKNLSYDEDYCKKSVGIFHSCIEELKTAKSKITGNYVGCNAARTIQMVSSNITSCIRSLEDIETSMENIQRGIEDLIVVTTSKMKSYDAITIVDNNLKYNWTPVSYVKDYRDVFSQRLNNRNSSDMKVLEKREISPSKVDSSATLGINSSNLSTESVDAQVEKVNDNVAVETPLEWKETVAQTNEQVEYQKNQQGINITGKEASIVSDENYQAEGSSFVGTNSNVIENKQEDYELNGDTLHTEVNMNLSNNKEEDYSNADSHLSSTSHIELTKSKDDYSATKGTVGASSNIGSIGSIKVEKFDTSSSTLNSVGNSGIHLEKAEYTESGANLNMNSSMNVSLEKNSSFEE